MRILVLIPALFLLFVTFSFGLPADQSDVKKVIVIEKEADGHHFGIIVAKPDKEALEKYSLDGGAEVLKVYQDSPAEKAGLAEHDIIVKFDGERIDDPEDLEDYFAELDEEKDVDIVVIRDGKELIFTAHVTPQSLEDKEIVLRLKAEKLKARADSLVKGLKTKFSGMPFLNPKGGYLGVEAETLSQQLAAYFEVEFGVLVKEVIEDSPAEKSGIKAGDVIYKINEKEIHDVHDLVRTINYYDPGNKVKIYLKRKGKKQMISVELGKKRAIEKNFENFKWFQNIPRDAFEMGKYKGRLWHPYDEDEEQEIFEF